MTGHARRLLYETAILTGLRSSELAALTRVSMMLSAEKPYILLEARSTKNRKAARQYIKIDLARELTAHVARLIPGACVFNMPRREHVAKMLRHDLDDARAAWIADAGDDAAERTRREGSDFLRADDHNGRVLDFHSLRHTCGSWAAMGGASPKALQTLMRHSAITLTLDTYGHLLPDEAAQTVERMPTIEPMRLRLTGTMNTPETPSTAIYAVEAQNRAKSCDGMRWERAGADGEKAHKTPGKRGKTTERGGFEPPMTETAIPDFESGAFNRSATSPGGA